MSEERFCHCCRVYHPADQMRQYMSKNGLRWRCLRSIQAAQCSIGERDAFGQQQTEINRAAAQQTAERAFVPLAEKRRR